MISLIDKEELHYIPKISFMQTACLISAFKNSALAPEVWVQKNNEKITAVISRFGGRLNITADCADYEEIREFIEVVGFSEIFCEKEVAEKLGVSFDTDFCVLKARVKKQRSFCDIPPLFNLYTTLNQGDDGEITLPDFEVFATDVSHRLRHGGAVATLEDSGAAVAFSCDFGGIINGIAVNKASRANGIGSRLLKDVCDYLDGDVFVCTNENTAKFYIKNGFTECDKAVLIRG